jgi:hypothetical protein
VTFMIYVKRVVGQMLGAFRKDGMGRGDNTPCIRENLIEVTSGPDEEGKHTFFVYWRDDEVPPEGIRAQVFLADLKEFTDKHKPNRVGDRR